MRNIKLFALLFLWEVGAFSQDLSLMSYNIRVDLTSDGIHSWHNRKDYLTDQIKFYEPDIFGIQEAAPHQAVFIAKRLPNYDYCGIGRDGIGKGESANIFYKRDRFILKKEYTFWISETPEVISKGWDAAVNRICTYALFQDKKTKRMFWVFNTHLDHLGDEARTKGIALILSKISEVNTDNHTVFLMGDLNSLPETQRIENLKKTMDDSKDISIAAPFGPLGTFNGFDHSKAVTKRIDYIFVSKSNLVNVDKYAVLSDSKNLRYPSDHLPVYIEISFSVTDE